MEKYSVYWDAICKIYFLTKHYLILGEEMSDDFDTFLQPIKEHRDAFDHIARVYGQGFLDDEVMDLEKYQCENMNKAVGHVYRAFFDAADWLTYICRRKIREMLNGKTYKEIVSVYPQYKELKTRLIEIPEEIAKIREKKDVSDEEGVLIQEVETYRNLLDELLSSYKEVYNVFG